MLTRHLRAITSTVSTSTFYQLLLGRPHPNYIRGCILYSPHFTSSAKKHILLSIISACYSPMTTLSHRILPHRNLLWWGIAYLLGDIIPFSTRKLPHLRFPSSKTFPSITSPPRLILPDLFALTPSRRDVGITQHRERSSLLVSLFLSFSVSLLLAIHLRHGLESCRYPCFSDHSRLFLSLLYR